ncbi:MAG: GumC family protein [Clostridiales bacterium]
MPESINTSKNKTGEKEELSLSEIFRIIYNRKSILFVSAFLFVLMAFIYNKSTKPVYEASVLLKKDKGNQEKAEKDELKDIVLLQSFDEIETEMEIVKTREVLDNVADELMLYLNIDKINEPDGKTLNVQQLAVDYNRNYLNEEMTGNLPTFILLGNSAKSNKSLFIKKIDSVNFGLYNKPNDSLLQSSSAAPFLNIADSQAAVKADSLSLSSINNEPSTFVHSYVEFKTAGMHIVIDWPKAVIGNSVYFNLGGYYDTIEKLDKSLKVEHVVKTDIFQITAESASPYASQKIANATAEKFRELRINQQKQGIRYSFNFVDKQLQDVWGKLKNAENELSKYKSARHITSIDESSRSLVEFLSNLEAEKIKTNLELTQNEDKLAQMKNQLKNKGYIDETYLTPHETEQSGSPFANLLRQLSDLEIQRIELLQKRTENHPEVLAVDQRLKQIKGKLTDYNQNTLNAYQILINSAKKKQAELNDLTAKYANKIQELPPEESHLAELLRQKDVYEKIFTLLLNQREEMRIAELSKLQDIVIVDQAHEPQKPVTPKEALNLAIGLLAGIFIGFAGIIVKELRDRKLISLEEIEKGINIPIYAIIPDYSKALTKKIKNAKNISERFVTMMDDQDGFRESFRVLKTKIEFKLNNSSSKIIMFTSCEENTGKTSVVSNLAISFAHSNKKILVVDFDLRKASLSSVFKKNEDSPGLLGFLMGETKAPDICPLVLGENGDKLKTLYILPSGGIVKASGDLISSEKMRMLLFYLKSQLYDYVLIDTPPVTRVSDVLNLGRYIKNAFLVVRPQWTFRDSLQWGLKEMEQENINIQGIIINACNIKRSSFRYRYGYGYNYGQNPI